MEIQNQVCTKQQGEKLYSLGIQFAGSYFYWHFGSVSETWVIVNKEESNIFPSADYPAFTVAELGVMLPALSHSWVTKGNSYFNCSDNFNVGISIVFCENTEAEARAALLIYLLEEKVITPEEVNQKLNNQ